MTRSRLHPLPLSLLVLAALACLFAAPKALAADATPHAVVDLFASSDPHVINSTGIGTVSAKPDAVKLILGVSAQAETAAEAQKDVSGRINHVLDTLKGLGIDPQDIETSNYVLNPVYDYQSKERTLVGYSASYRLSVLSRHLDAAGKLLDKAVAAGANEVQGVQFILLDQEGARQAALKAAVAQARTRAQTVAEALGLKLGSVLDVSLSAGSAPPPIVYAAAAKAFDRMELQPGQVEISEHVQIKFALVTPDDAQHS